MNYITYANTNNASSNSVCPVCMGRGTLLSGVKTEQGYIATTTPIAECPKCQGIGYINLYWGGGVAV
jgi:DnaJ-class molecular chaperone